jgi:hypothetical protein
MLAIIDDNNNDNIINNENDSNINNGQNKKKISGHVSEIASKVI